jgi:hypothetical protein
LLPRLTSLSLEWRNSITAPLTPMARLTQLTGLMLRGYTAGAMEADWLPPNLEVLILSADDGVGSTNYLRGIGGAGWLAALHTGACPKLRALHLDHLAARDVRPGGEWRGLTLANTLPRLTALEELAVSVYPHRPIPAAPLLAALPNLWYCHAEFVNERDGYGPDLGISRKEFLRRRGSPMLLATPDELATLRAPRLRTLSIGLVASSDAKDRAWRCRCNGGGNAGHGGGAVGAAVAGAPAGAARICAGGGLAALRSLKLFVGCGRAAGGAGPLWDLSALPPRSLPALRRLLVLPLTPMCGTARLPLDALARAAPGLQRLMIDPTCAGPLDALFRAGGCAWSLRWVGVFSPLRNDDAAAASARVEAEVRAGLRVRAAAAAVVAQRYGCAVPHITVALFQPEGQPSSTASIVGATIERRKCGHGDKI